MGILSEKLGRFSADIETTAIPDAVRAHAATMVVDMLASAAGGYNSELAKVARDAAADLWGSGPATVWFGADNLNWIGAAYVNSSAATALDIDDGHRGACGHAGGAVIPAALAVAERVGASGRDTLDAIVLGYDVALRIATHRVAPIASLNSGPWSAYGAAVAAGRLLGLDGDAMMHAIAIAGAEAPASLPISATARLGSTVKESIPWSVVAGISAAIRAKNGGTGPDDLLDRPDVFHPEKTLEGLGQDWYVLGNYLKPYSCCRYIHSSVDAIAALREPGRTPVSVAIRTFEAGLALPNQARPDSPESAQYSYPFCAALALLRGIDALRPMDPSVIYDEEILALSQKVSFCAGEEFAQDFPLRTPASVTIDYGDGPKSLEVRHPLGDVANPMSAEQVHEKFLHFTSRHLNAAQCDLLYQASLSLAERDAVDLLRLVAIN